MALSHADREALVAHVRRSVIGEAEAVQTPFGPRRVVYADYTASGRALSFVEDHLREVVLPLYANTHTQTSGTGRQTTRFREDARRSSARPSAPGRSTWCCSPAPAPPARSTS
jgi:selenocysteine lyase/cysteine desulfurase